MDYVEKFDANTISAGLPTMKATNLVTCWISMQIINKNVVFQLQLILQVVIPRRFEKQADWTCF